MASPAHGDLAFRPTRSRAAFDTAWGLLAALLAAAAAINAWGAIIAGSILLLAVALVARPLVLEVSAISILAVRPSLDAFSARQLGLFHGNPAVALGVSLILVAAALAIDRAKAGLRIWPDRKVLSAHLWLFLAVGIGGFSGARLYGVSGLEVAAREAIRVISIVSAFLLISWWVTDPAVPRRRGWIYLVAGLVPPMLAAIWQLVTGSGYLETQGLNRLQATFSHPNSFGAFLVPLCLLTVCAGTLGAGAARRMLLIAAAFLMILLVLTFSRTGLLALALGAATIPLLQMRRAGVRNSARLLFVLVALLAVGWLAVGGLIRQRFAELSPGQALSQGFNPAVDENSLQWRLVNWGVLIRLGLQHPWFGHGAGMTEVLNPVINQNTGTPFNAHDDFVRFFFETGIVGLMAYLLYGVSLGRWLIHMARRATGSLLASTLAVTVSFLALFFFTGGAPELSLQTAVQYELYALMALSLPEVARDGTARSPSLLRFGERDARQGNRDPGQRAE